MYRYILIYLLVTCLLPGLAEAQDVVTFDEAWEWTLARHPAVAVSEAELESRRAMVARAGRGPLAELEFEAENFAGTDDFRGFDNADLTLQAARTWEFGGQAGHRTAAAEASLQIGLEIAEQAHRELRRTLASAFVDVLAARRRIDLADSLARVAQDDRQSVERRVSAGAENRVQGQLALLAEAESRNLQRTSRQELSAARLVLGSLWGADDGSYPPVGGELSRLATTPTWDEVLIRVPDSPAVDMALRQSAAARAQIDIARSEGSLDLTTALGVRHFRDGGDNALVMSVGVPLGLGGRAGDAVRIATSQHHRSEAVAQATAIDLKNELARVWNELVISTADVNTIRSELLPAATLAMDEADRAYERGRFSVTEVLMVRRTWTEWQLELVDALARHHHASIRLAALLGDDPVGEVLR